MEQKRMYLLAKEIFDYEQLLTDEKRIVTRWIMRKDSYQPEEGCFEDVTTAIKRLLLPETDPFNFDYDKDNLDEEIEAESDPVRYQIIADDYCRRKSLKPIKLTNKLFTNIERIVFKQNSGEIICNTLSDLKPSISLFGLFVALEQYRVHSLIPTFLSNYDSLNYNDKFLVANIILDILAKQTDNIEKTERKYQVMNDIVYLHNANAAACKMTEYLKDNHFFESKDIKEMAVLANYSLNKEMQEKCYHALLNITEKRHVLYNLCINKGQGFEENSMYSILSDVLDENCAPFLSKYNIYGGAQTLDDLICKVEKQGIMEPDVDSRDGSMSINYVVPISFNPTNFLEE